MVGFKQGNLASRVRGEVREQLLELVVGGVTDSRVRICERERSTRVVIEWIQVLSGFLESPSGS